jgi:hypothetical protein
MPSQDSMRRLYRHVDSPALVVPSFIWMNYGSLACQLCLTVATDRWFEPYRVKSASLWQEGGTPLVRACACDNSIGIGEFPVVRPPPLSITLTVIDVSRHMIHEL